MIWPCRNIGICPETPQSVREDGDLRRTGKFWAIGGKAAVLFVVQKERVGVWGKAA